LVKTGVNALTVNSFHNTKRNLRLMANFGAAGGPMAAGDVSSRRRRTVEGAI
jgi:hypothetical protein